MGGTPELYGFLPVLAGFPEKVGGGEGRLPMACHSGQEGCQAAMMNREVVLISLKWVLEGY